MESETLQLTTEEILKLLPEKVIIEGKEETKKVVMDGLRLDPRPSQRIVNHCPDGFSWGHKGCGTGQLALAILLYYLPSEIAYRYHQDFKFKVVATWLFQSDFKVTLNLREVMKLIIEKRAS